MNRLAMMEVGELLRVVYRFDVRKFRSVRLTPKEIMETVEYQHFKKSYPELCRIIEGAKR